jgi:hypothetical protein
MTSTSQSFFTLLLHQEETVALLGQHEHHILQKLRPCLVQPPMLAGCTRAGQFLSRESCLAGQVSRFHLLLPVLRDPTIACSTYLHIGVIGVCKRLGESILVWTHPSISPQAQQTQSKPQRPIPRHPAEPLRAARRRSHQDGSTVHCNETIRRLACQLHSAVVLFDYCSLQKQLALRS